MKESLKTTVTILYSSVKGKNPYLWLRLKVELLRLLFIQVRSFIWLFEYRWSVVNFYCRDLRYHKHGICTDSQDIIYTDVSRNPWIPGPIGKRTERKTKTKHKSWCNETFVSTLQNVESDKPTHSEAIRWTEMDRRRRTQLSDGVKEYRDLWLILVLTFVDYAPKT